MIFLFVYTHFKFLMKSLKNLLEPELCAGFLRNANGPRVRREGVFLYLHGAGRSWQLVRFCPGRATLSLKSAVLELQGVTWGTYRDVGVHAFVPRPLTRKPLLRCPPPGAAALRAWHRLLGGAWEARGWEACSGLGVGHREGARSALLRTETVSVRDARFRDCC